jgi:hypothetical protein
MKSVQINKVYCPHCNELIDGAAHPEGRTPEENDASICVYCANVSIYQGHSPELTLRKPTTEEQAQFNADPEFRAARRLVLELRGQRFR